MIPEAGERSSTELVGETPNGNHSRLSGNREPLDVLLDHRRDVLQ